MNRLLLIAACTGLAALAQPALSSPTCYFPKGGGLVLELNVGGTMSDEEKAEFYEMRLRQKGIDARDTTIWSGCIQTTVHENGHFEMRFYDPFTLEEIPLD